MGWYFEDFERVGTGHRWLSRERRIGADDIASFASLTGDTHPQHLDPDYGARSPYGACIAHGFLTISIASGLVFGIGLDEGTAHAILGTSWRLPAPVLVDDVLRVTVTLTGCRPSRKHPEFGIVERRYTVTNQHAVEVAVGDIALLCKRRP